MDPKLVESIPVWRDPLGYPWSTYLWVIVIACVASTVKYLNGMKKFRMGRLLIDILTAGFIGVLTFWLCEAREIRGPMSAVAIAVAGAMGNRAWAEFENIWRVKFGLKPAEQPTQEEAEK
jgi:hypothetical protein